MVDIASLDVAATGAFSRFHNYAKNVETAHLGHAYSSVLDNLDHYVIKGVAEPVLSKAPEWVSDNRVITAIRSHQGISIAVGAALTLISLVSFWIWLHPAGKTTTSTNTNPPNTTPPPSGDDDETDSVDGDDDTLNFVPDLADDGTKTSGTAEGGKGTKATDKKGSEVDEDPFAEKPVGSHDSRRTSTESNATASGAEDDDDGVRKNLSSSFATEGTGGGVTGRTTGNGDRIVAVNDFLKELKEVQESRTETAESDDKSSSSTDNSPKKGKKSGKKGKKGFDSSPISDTKTTQGSLSTSNSANKGKKGSNKTQNSGGKKKGKH